MHVLMVGSAQDEVLIRTRQQLAGSGATVHVIANLADASLSLAMGSDVVASALRLDGELLPIATLQTIVVSNLFAGASSLLQPEDQNYAAAEIFAAWLAFLATAPCRVVNRPGANFNYRLQSSLHLRALARSLMISTVDEVIWGKRDLVRARARGDSRACLDLSSDEPFWLSGDYPLAAGHLYSVIDLTEDTSFAVTARVGSECLTIEYARGEARPSEPLVAEQAERATVTLLDALGLDYGFCVFSAGGGEPRFSRLFTVAQPFFASKMVDWSSSRLTALTLSEYYDERI